MLPLTTASGRRRIAGAAAMVAVGIVACGTGPAAASTPSTAAVATISAVARPCAADPVMKVWYDSDQTGSWANAWLEAPAKCDGKWVHLALRLYCIEGTPKKKLYEKANSGSGRPFSLPWTILPKTCTKFRAYGDLVNIVGTVHSDVWSWRYGYPPA